jgi:AraC family transcriptional regulator, regulatory protein of adaptative response / DNA-3-methyladenine glycosylase II
MVENGGMSDDGTISLRLPYRPPLDLGALLRFLGARAVPGVEECVDGTYRRALTLPHGTGLVTLQDGETAGHVRCRLRLSDPRDLDAAVARCRRLLDLDADPLAVAESLGRDHLLGPLVAASPGRRVPGHVDPAELAVRAVLGQQVSVAAARTLAGRLAAHYGTPLRHPAGTVTHTFPTPAALAAADEADLAMPRARRHALIGLAAALANGTVRLDPGTDRDQAARELLALPGIGPWTVAYIRMRALGDPDVFMPTDLGVRHVLRRLGQPADPAAAEAAALRWRPWRSYALQHLWGVLDTGPSETATPAARPRPEPAGAAEELAS